MGVSRLEYQSPQVAPPRCGHGGQGDHGESVRYGKGGDEKGADHCCDCCPCPDRPTTPQPTTILTTGQYRAWQSADCPPANGLLLPVRMSRTQLTDSFHPLPVPETVPLPCSGPKTRTIETTTLQPTHPCPTI